MEKIVVIFMSFAIAGCGGGEPTEFAPADESLRANVETFMKTVVQRVNSVKRRDKFEATLESTLYPSLPYQERTVVLARLRETWGASSVKVTNIETNSHGQIQAKVVFSNKKSKGLEITFNLLEHEGKLTIAGVL